MFYSIPAGIIYNYNYNYKSKRKRRKKTIVRDTVIIPGIINKQIKIQYYNS